MEQLDCLNQVAEFHRTFKHPILDTPKFRPKIAVTYVWR